MKLKLVSLLVSASALAISVTPVLVQAKESSQPTNSTVNLAQRLNLTSEQQVQITPIRQQTSNQVQSLLTPEQQAPFKTPEPQNARELAIMSALNLSSAQKAQLQQIELTSPQQIESILTPGQRQLWLQRSREEDSGR